MGTRAAGPAAAASRDGAAADTPRGWERGGAMNIRFDGSLRFESWDERRGSWQRTYGNL